MKYDIDQIVTNTGLDRTQVTILCTGTFHGEDKLLERLEQHFEFDVGNIPVLRAIYDGTPPSSQVRSEAKSRINDIASKALESVECLQDAIDLLKLVPEDYDGIHSSTYEEVIEAALRFASVSEDYSTIADVIPTDSEAKNDLIDKAVELASKEREWLKIIRATQNSPKWHRHAIRSYIKFYRIEEEATAKK